MSSTNPVVEKEAGAAPTEKEAGVAPVEKEADVAPVEKEAGTASAPVDEKKKREYKDFAHDENEATRQYSPSCSLVVPAMLTGCSRRCQGRHVAGEF
jgi:hypothetical protein